MELKKIVNEGLKIKKKGRKLSFLAGCVIENKLFFSSWHDKGFYKLDLNTGQCTLLKIFEEEPENQLLFNQAIYFEGGVWLIPAYGKNIVKVDLESLDITYISLPKEGREIRGKGGKRFGKFTACYQEEKSEFWLIPIGYSMLLKVDMITNQISEFKELGENISFKEGVINFSNACFVGDKIWMCPQDCEKLVTFDTKTGEFQFINWKYNGENYRIIKRYKDWLFFLPHSAMKNILFIDHNTLEEKKIAISIDWEKKADFMYLLAEIIDHEIFLVPFLAHEYVSIDLEDGTIQIDKTLHGYVKDMLWEQERFQACIIYDNKMLFTSDEKDMPLMIYDLKSNTVSYMDLALDQTDYETFLSDLYNENKKQFYKWIESNEQKMLLENDLPVFLYCAKIDQLTNEIEKKRFDCKTIGESIFYALK